MSVEPGRLSHFLYMRLNLWQEMKVFGVPSSTIRYLLLMVHCSLQRIPLNGTLELLHQNVQENLLAQNIFFIKVECDTDTSSRENFIAIQSQSESKTRMPCPPNNLYKNMNRIGMYQTFSKQF